MIVPSICNRLYTEVPRLEGIHPVGPSRSLACLVEGDTGSGEKAPAWKLILKDKRQGERCHYVTLSRSNSLT